MEGRMEDTEPHRWTEERVSRLQAMWGEGQSARQIALGLGGITRNTVIGKLDRLGLLKSRSLDGAAPRTAQPQATRPVPAPTQAGVAAPRRDAPVPATTPVVQPVALPRAPLQAIPPEERVQAFLPRKVTIMELGSDMCRWPLGDPSAAEFRYCGHASKPGQPYCAHHAVMAYEPPRQRSGR